MGHENNEPKGCNTGGIVTFSLGLVSGTFSSLFCKMAYDTSSVGLDGEIKMFSKPIMMLLLMFTGMVPPLGFWAIQQYFTKPEDRDVIPLKTMMVLIIPSICDLLCTLLLLVAQLYLTASLQQMMRGSVICITALLKRFVLNHHLRKHMWIGVGIITFAMLIVASTTLMGDSPDAAAVSEASNGSTSGAYDAEIEGGGTTTGKVTEPKDPRIGVALVLVGCIAQGVQYVFEEKVMSVDNAPPLIVIGFEGLWGTILSLVLIYPLAYWLPGADNGSFEDPYDAFAMINNNHTLKMFCFGFVATVTVYNCMAVYVTKYLSAIWHAILDNFRPITIWGLDLAIFYVLFPNQGLGERWTDASWVQLMGLFVLFYGTAYYNGSITTFEGEDTYVEIPGEGEEGAFHSRIIGTPTHMASPALMRSPLVYRSPSVKRDFEAEKADDAKRERRNSAEIQLKGRTYSYNA